MQIKCLILNLTMILLTLISPACGTGTSSLTPSSQPELNSPLATSLPTVIAPTVTTVGKTQESECGPIAFSRMSFSGGILFYEYDSPESPAVTRVWFWSNDMASAQSILEIGSNVQLYLSPNGEKLVWHEYKADHFTTYDLISKKQEDFPWKTSWQSIRGWKDEKTVSILVKYEETYNVGRTEEYVNFDLSAQSFTSQAISLNLPGYTGHPRFFPPYVGFAVMDPTESVVIYTRIVDRVGRLALINKDSGEVLWEHEAPYALFPDPDWTSGGKRVAFVLYDDKRPIFYILTQDGKTSEIIGEGTPPRIIRYIKWSSDEKYIYYSYWNTIMEGPAFIIDMATKEMKEICTPGYTFLKGSWLPGNYFAYIVREGEQTDQDGIAEMRIMNAEDQTFQTVFRTTTKVGPTTGFLHALEILGWTPLSNP